MHGLTRIRYGLSSIGRVINACHGRSRHVLVSRTYRATEKLNPKFKHFTIHSALTYKHKIFTWPFPWVGLPCMGPLCPPTIAICWFTPKEAVENKNLSFGVLNNGMVQIMNLEEGSDEQTDDEGASALTGRVYRDRKCLVVVLRAFLQQTTTKDPIVISMSFTYLSILQESKKKKKKKILTLEAAIDGVGPGRPGTNGRRGGTCPAPVPPTYVPG